ncbi:hypothetical protein RJT34_17128 [Clitoria ternatea]|uniref:FH2 domain-containing protein n=1 Tax=Clitoria ternatea TaxID=43366 RepID=A0AAN9J9Z9_CLITE
MERAPTWVIKGMGTTLLISPPSYLVLALGCCFSFPSANFYFSVLITNLFLFNSSEYLPPNPCVFDSVLWFRVKGDSKMGWKATEKLIRHWKILKGDSVKKHIKQGKVMKGASLLLNHQSMPLMCKLLIQQRGNELPLDFLQTLLKMAPTSDGELKLRLFTGELSQLWHADHFFKAMVNMPYAFKQMEALLFMGTFKEELEPTMEFVTILEHQAVKPEQ